MSHSTVILALVIALANQTRRCTLIDAPIFICNGVRAVSVVSILTSSFFYLIASNALKHTVWMQLSAAFVASTTSWFAYVLLINKTMDLPTRRQWISLGFYVCIDMFTQLQLRLVID